MTTAPATDAARLAGQAARRAYLNLVPEPRALDFPCPRCHAAPEQPCDRPDDYQEPHIARQDRRTRAFTRRQAEASNADDAAYTIYVERSYDRTPESVARALPRRYRVPYLVAKGWRPAGKHWLPPLPAGRTPHTLAQAIRAALTVTEEGW